ncbi:MAG: hypothetical protein ACREDR_42510, partial [Blastocatellia bacterium]
MTKLTRKQIQKRALEIVSESPGGIKNAALLAKISQASPETPKKSIYSAIWNLDREYPEAV